MRYPKPEDAPHMSNEDLIEWLAQIAYDATEDWGWIKDELMRRLAGVCDAPPLPKTTYGILESWDRW